MSKPNSRASEKITCSNSYGHITCREKATLSLLRPLPSASCTLYCSEQVLSKSFVIHGEPIDCIVLSRVPKGLRRGVQRKESIFIWREVCWSQDCWTWPLKSWKNPKVLVKTRGYLFCFLRHYCKYLPGQESWLIIIDWSSDHEVIVKSITCTQHYIPEKWGVPRKIMTEMDILVLVFPLCPQTSPLQSSLKEPRSSLKEPKTKSRLCKLSKCQTVVAIWSVFIILKSFLC